MQRDARASRSLLVRALEDKLARALDRIYRLLGLIYPWKDVAAARYTIEHSDARTRAGAIEYMDNLLGGAVRKRVDAPHRRRPDGTEGAARQLLPQDPRTRPRETRSPSSCTTKTTRSSPPPLSIFVEERQLWSLIDDLEFAVAQRTVADRYVLEAASWALAAYRLSDERRDFWMEPLPAVELAHRARKIELFDFVSVDELFRIAGAGRQVRHEGGRALYSRRRPGRRRAVPARRFGARVWRRRRAVRPRRAGRARLRGDARRQPAPPHDLRRRSCDLPHADPRPVPDDAVGQYRAGAGAVPHAPRYPEGAPVAHGLHTARLRTGDCAKLPLLPLEKVLLLRQNPLLARATVNQLLDLAAIAREVPLAAGSVLFTETDQPAVYHVLRGEVRLEATARPSRSWRSGQHDRRVGNTGWCVARPARDGDGATGRRCGSITTSCSTCSPTTSTCCRACSAALLQAHKPSMVLDSAPHAS